MPENTIRISMNALFMVTNLPQTMDRDGTISAYIRGILLEDSNNGNRGIARPKEALPVGRPLKSKHPHYTDADLKAIRAYILEEASNYPGTYENAKGKPPKGLADDQPDDECLFRLDNGVRVAFAERVEVVGGRAMPLYPPGVLE